MNKKREFEENEKEDFIDFLPLDEEIEEEEEEEEEGLMPAFERMGSLIDLMDRRRYTDAYYLALGFEPIYDREGNTVGYKQGEVTPEKQALAFLLLADKIQFATSNLKRTNVTYNDILFAFEKIKTYLRIAGVDMNKLRVPFELAKLNFLLGSSLADQGLFLRALLNVPLEREEEEKIPLPQEKRGAKIEVKRKEGEENET